MTIAIPVWVNETLYTVVNLAALILGRRDERLVGAVFGLGQIAGLFIVDESWPPVQWALFATDTATFVAVGVIALKSERFWPMVLAGLQLLSVGTHVAKLVDQGTQQWAYISALVLWSHLENLTIGVATWNAAVARWRSGHLFVGRRSTLVAAPPRRKTRVARPVEGERLVVIPATCRPSGALRSCPWRVRRRRPRGGIGTWR